MALYLNISRSAVEVWIGFFLFDFKHLKRFLPRLRWWFQPIEGNRTCFNSKWVKNERWILSTTQEHILSASELSSITNLKLRCLGPPKRAHTPIKSMTELKKNGLELKERNSEAAATNRCNVNWGVSDVYKSKVSVQYKAKLVRMEKAPRKVTHDLLSNGIWCYISKFVYDRRVLGFMCRFWQWLVLLWNKVIASSRFNIKSSTLST